MPDKDVTDLVKFQNKDGSMLPIIKCVCGARFQSRKFMIGIYRDNPTYCELCGRPFYFSVEIRVYQVM